MSIMPMEAAFCLYSGKFIHVLERLCESKVPS